MAAGIYTLVSEERLNDVLETLHLFTGLTVLLTDESGGHLHACGETAACCALLRCHVCARGQCNTLRLKAGQRSQALGEACVFTCPAKFSHITFALQRQGELLGCVIIGPFLMDGPDSTLLSGIAAQNEPAPSICLGLDDDLQGLQLIPPEKATLLRRLIDHLLKPLMPAQRALTMQSRQKAYRQSHVSETIRRYKEQGEAPAQSYPYQKETELITRVKTGNVRQAKALLNELLGYVLFSQGGKPDAVRTRAIELTTLLSRVAMEGGAKADTIYQLNKRFLSLMHGEDTLDDLCLLLQDVVESFMGLMFASIDRGNAHIRRALGIMAERYAQPLTLPMVAMEIGLSPNYLSSLFQKTVGLSFRQKLCAIRVEESKLLLLSTDYSLAAIAASMGFADQSYFCKVFKRMTGLTPGQYRR